MREYIRRSFLEPSLAATEAAANPLSLPAYWWLAVGLAVLGLAVAVAGSAPPAPLTAASGHRVLFSLPPAVLALALIAGTVFVLGLIAALWPGRKRKEDDDFVVVHPPVPLLRQAEALLVLAVAVLVIGAGVWLLVQHQGWFPASHAPLPATTLTAAPSSPLFPAPALAPPVRFAGASALLTFFVLASATVAFAVAWGLWREAFWRLWLPRASRRPAEAPAPALGAAVESSPALLVSGRDPRRAVLACYRHFERMAAKRFHHRHLWQTAEEYLAEALAGLALPPQPATVLLALFERARFGNEVLSEGDRRNAITALSQLRAALSGKDTDAPGK